MIPFRVSVVIHVKKGTQGVWKSSNVTLLEVPGDSSKARVIGAAMSILGLVSHIKNMPLNRLFARKSNLVKRKKK